MDINPAEYDGIALSGFIRRGELSASEILDAVIENIEKLNPELNAVVFKHYEYARASVEELDKTKKSPLFGVPFFLKNLLLECKGTPFSDSSGFIDGFVSEVDFEIVKRYRAAGLIIAGKTNASEFGMKPVSSNRLYGLTLNPWNTRYTTGGSSGGSAAAVASGMVPFAHGNDGGGSLRIPASCCGLFALKPSRARNSLAPIFGDLGGGIACDHVVSRSVRDSAAVLDISHGPAAGDPYYAPYYSGRYLEEAGKEPGRLHIGILSEVPEGWNDETVFHPDCRKAVEDAAALCVSMGHDVEEIDSSELAWPDIPSVFLKIYSCFVGHTVFYWERVLNKKIKETDLEPATWELYQASRNISGAQYLSALEYLQLFTRMIANWYEAGRRDLLLSPTIIVPPLETGAFEDSDINDPQKWIRNSLLYVALTRTQNITGQPAMSVPLYWNADGLPVGVQFAGKTGAEDLLVRLAAQLEKARPWFNKTPGIFAGKVK